jgi:hypothetical protein
MADTPWDAPNDPTVVFPTIQGVAVYRGEANGLVVCSEAIPGGDLEDPVIVIPAAFVDAFRRKVNAVADEIAERAAAEEPTP